MRKAYYREKVGVVHEVGQNLEEWKKEMQKKIEQDPYFRKTTGVAVENKEDYENWKKEKRDKAIKEGKEKEWNEPKVNWLKFEAVLKIFRRRKKLALEQRENDLHKFLQQRRKAKTLTMPTDPELAPTEEVKSKHASSEPEPANCSHSEQEHTKDSENNSHTKQTFEPESAKHSASVGASQELPEKGIQTDSKSSQTSLKPPRPPRPPKPPKPSTATGVGVTSRLAPVQGSQKETDMEEDTSGSVSGAESLRSSNAKIGEKDVLDGTAELEPVYDCMGEKELAEKIKRLLGEDDKYWYEFLGECYIHGMMDGEAMAHQNDTETPARVFELR